MREPPNRVCDRVSSKRAGWPSFQVARWRACCTEVVDDELPHRGVGNLRVPRIRRPLAAVDLVRDQDQRPTRHEQVIDGLGNLQPSDPMKRLSECDHSP